MEVGSIERPSDPARFLSHEEQDSIVRCIQEAEKITAAEIRTRIELRCERDPIEHCRELLEKLGITQTRGRSGLLIFFSIEDHKVAIYGDTAIDAVIGNNGWASHCSRLSERFAQGDFAPAICDCIASIGKILAEHFPPGPQDLNELPDQPSF